MVNFREFLKPGNRTFAATFLAQITISAALFTRHATAGEWITAIGIFMSIYAGKSLGETIANRDKPPDPC